jgi:hypothetical protein
MSLRLCAVSLFAVIAGGCGFGSGVGALDGSLFVRGCSQSNDYGSLSALAGYSLSPTFFEGDPVDSPTYERRFHPVNRINIRVENVGRRSETADVLFVTIADDAPVAAALNTPLPLGPATNVRATLKLNETCRYAEADAELDGTITFSAFGGATGGGMVPDNFHISFDDRVAATLKVTVVDRRALTLGGVGPVPTTPAVAGQLTGSFDFIVRPGRTNPQF